MVTTYKRKAGESAARLALRNISRATLNWKGEPTKTLLINVATMKPVPVSDWPKFHKLMSGFPHYWRVDTAIVSDEWDGENWEHYDLTPKVQGRVERLLLSTVTKPLNEAGQELVDQRVGSRVRGIGNILSQHTREMSEEHQRSVLEITKEFGLTVEELPWL